MIRCTIAAVLSLSAAAAATLSVCAQDPARDAQPGLNALRAASGGAEIGIYPVRVLDRPDREVGDALGLVLERRGMRALQRSAGEFAPAGADAEWTEIAAAFAAHATSQKDAPAHALYAEFLGTPATGPEEVRFAIVDARGTVEVAERHTSADAGFRRALGRGADPMSCCTFVADRVAALLALPSAAGEAKDGTFATLWRAKSGEPDAAELEAMKSRLAVLRDRHAEARFSILPTRVDGTAAADRATELASLLSERLRLHASAEAAAVDLQVAPTRNEQKRLWDFARALREKVRSHPVAADYVLMADYALDPHGEAGTVHFAVCDRYGELVLVDYRNAHHADFKELAPKTAADCDRLVVERLKGYLR